MNDNIGWIGQDHDVFVAFKARLLTRLLRRYRGDPKQARVLDVGCGIGLIDQHLVDAIGEVHGIDVSADSIRIAAEGCPGAHFLSYDGSRIPHPDGTFDLAFAVCVVHHVPPAEWNVFAAEMARVLKPGGIAVIVEHNPFNPVTRQVVKNCEFDHDAVLLTAGTCQTLMRQAGLRIAEKKYITFIPFQARAVEIIEGWLGWLPLGAQYFAAGVKS